MIDVHTWVIEVGFRAALHTETLQRDLRWFRSLYR
jgi:hypothetical protein